MYANPKSHVRSPDYTTTELALAAYLKASGWSATVIPPRTQRGLCVFAFHGEPFDLHKQVENFLQGASVSALDFYDALNSLRTLVRYARGGAG